ncbi:MAG: Mur ligase family protein [Chloroflexota bacterium]|nr:Mur ligase family protein [Chloroflexota bacterium]
MSLGLQRIQALMEALDRPERGLRGALVAGTNGKGSVIEMVRSVLVASGARVGTMPKPHLVSYRERIAIDGSPLSPQRFANAVAAVLPAVDQVGERLGPPTEFEALTAAAICELARQRVDLAVVEVGMGGRLDATNVLDLGVAVVTNVQHDHERFLGSTLAAIGGEKAAIVKLGDLAVTGASGRGLRPILDRCALIQVPLRRTGPAQPYRATLRSSGWRGIVIDALTPERELRDLSIGLLGSHQATNAAVALATLEALAADATRRHAPLFLSDTAIRTGMAAARWPGRLELIESERFGRVLLDGAHNPAGGAALANALAELGVERPVLVFGAMRGKRVSAVLRTLAPLRPRPLFTSIADPHAHRPGELLSRWRRIAPGGEVVLEPERALERAGELRRPDDPIVVAGSLYLVGAVRAILLGDGR